MNFTKLDYCQYLLSSQVNYTLTNLAEHLKSFSRDTINRYLKGEKLSPPLLWERTRSLLEPDSEAYLILTILCSIRASGRRSKLCVSSGAATKRAWSAAKETMLLIDGMKKTFSYCPLRSNQQVEDSVGEHPYQRVDTLGWSDEELRQGKLIRSRDFQGLQGEASGDSTQDTEI
jgi:hypothetical protein